MVKGIKKVTTGQIEALVKISDIRDMLFVREL